MLRNADDYKSLFHRRDAEELQTDKNAYYRCEREDINLNLHVSIQRAHNIQKTQILHHQGFDVRISGLSIIQMHFSG